MSQEPLIRKQAAIPRVGVGVLVVDTQKRVLLTLRNRPPEAGCWSIVGGKLIFWSASNSVR